MSSFSLKVKCTSKNCHLIWKLISGHVAVTRTLTRRQCDVITFFRDVGNLKSLTHAIFECPPALQAAQQLQCLIRIFSQYPSYTLTWIIFLEKELRIWRWTETLNGQFSIFGKQEMINYLERLIARDLLGLIRYAICIWRMSSMVHGNGTNY